MSTPKILGTVFGIILITQAAPLRAANIQALEASSGQCGSQDVCLVPDANWDVTPFSQTSYDPATDTVTGSGEFIASSTATGSSTVYLTEADGVTVSDILTLSYGVDGSTGGETMSVSWQSDNDGALNLGTAPVGATSIIETGDVQEVTALLAAAAGGNFPSNITVQAQSDVPEPASLALLGAGLTGLGFVRRRKGA